MAAASRNVAAMTSRNVRITDTETVAEPTRKLAFRKASSARPASSPKPKTISDQTIQ